MKLVYGLITGLLFGYFMQRSRVIRYDAQVGAMRLIDMTIVKFMMAAAVTASIGVYLLHDLRLVELSVKSTMIGANVIGGLIFGVGWALLGYCPGTAVGALGEGRWDSIWGILGMILGGGVFAAVFPAIKRTIWQWGAYGKITLADVLHVNHWVLIALFLIGSLLLFRWFERRDL